jgi:hypothetical protein
MGSCCCSNPFCYIGPGISVNNDGINLPGISIDHHGINMPGISINNNGINIRQENIWDINNLDPNYFDDEVQVGYESDSVNQL